MIKIKGKKYHLKKKVKEVIILLIIFILIFSFNIVFINKLTNDFRECDQALNQTCTFNDLQNYKRNK